MLKKHQKSLARKNRSQAAFCSRRRWGRRSVGGVLVADGFSPKASGTKELAFEVINSLAAAHRSDNFCPLPAASAAAAAVFHCAFFRKLSLLRIVRRCCSLMRTKRRNNRFSVLFSAFFGQLKIALTRQRSFILRTSNFSRRGIIKLT